MANGIVGNNDEWKLESENPYVTKPPITFGGLPKTGSISGYEASRLESTPLMATGKVFDLPQYQSIVNQAKEKTSDDLVNRWLASFNAIPNTSQFSSYAAAGDKLAAPPVTPPPVTAPVQPVVNTSVIESSDLKAANDQWEANWMNTGGQLSYAGLGVTGSVFQSKNQGAAEMADLEQQKQLGIVGRSGMAEYEESAKRMRSGGRAPSPQVETAKIGAVADIAKSNAAYQSKIYESAMKSNEEWAKLGIQAQDVQSKMKYRQSMIDDLMVKTGLTEPMKIKLAQAKTALEQTKVKRDFAMHALDKVKEDQMTEYRDLTMKMGGQTPELKKMFNDIQTNYQIGVSNIKKTIPLEGDTDTFTDDAGKVYIGKVVNGRWVDVTNQANKGVVGGQ